MIWCRWNSAASSGGLPSCVPLVIVAGALLAAVAAPADLGEAWLGPPIVLHGEMKAGAVLADGLFLVRIRFIWPGGSSSPRWPCDACQRRLFAMVALCFFLFRLILGEEAF